MRVTITIDDDIADALAQRAELLDVPFEQFVNDTLRRGLSPAVADAPRKYRVVPLRGGLLPGIDPMKLNQLNDQLEVEDFIKEHRE